MTHSDSTRQDKKPNLKPEQPGATLDATIVEPSTPEISHHVAQNARAPETDLPDSKPPESGGQTGLEPTRYGDWEKKGRCTDF